MQISNMLRLGGLIALNVMAVACSRGAEPASKTATPTSAAEASSASDSGISIAFKSDPDPPEAGDNAVEVTVKQAGAPVSDATITAVFYMPAMPSMNMPEMRSSFNLEHKGNGVYRGDGQLVMSGTWNVTVTASRQGEQIASKKFSVIAK